MKRDLIVLCLALCAACGGDDAKSDDTRDEDPSGEEGATGATGDGKPNTDTRGPDDGKVAAELSAAEIESLCRWTLSAQGDTLDAQTQCIVDVTASTATKAECEEGRALCMKLSETSDNDPSTSAALCEAQAGSLNLEGCTATVAEIKACVNALGEAATALAERPCGEQPASARTAPSACAELPQSCLAAIAATL